jgi:hypothetical protein
MGTAQMPYNWALLLNGFLKCGKYTQWIIIQP